jgi:DNA-binding beta-propeller fold protein YncE
VANSGADAVQVISQRTNRVVTAIPLSAPFWVAVNPRTDTIYVAGGLDNPALSVINGRTNKVAATIRLPNPPGRGRGKPTHQHRLRGVRIECGGDQRANQQDRRHRCGGSQFRQAFGVAVDPRANLIFVTSPTSNNVSAIGAPADALSCMLTVQCDRQKLTTSCGYEAESDCHYRGIVCALGVAKYVLAAWHSKLGRSESPVAGAIGCAVHRQGAPGPAAALHGVSAGIRGRYPSWSRRRVR